MTPVHISPTFQQEADIFRQFFDFETKNAVKKLPLLWLGLTIIILAALGYARPFFLFLSICSFAALVIFIGFYLIKFELAKRTFIQNLKKLFATENLDFTFEFNESGILQKGLVDEFYTTWKTISAIEINEDDIYLFVGKRQLNNIISKSKIGNENFTQFLEYAAKYGPQDQE